MSILASLMDYSKGDIVNKYLKYFVGQDPSRCSVLIGDNLGKTAGHFDDSDLIFVFDSKDTLLVLSERLHLTSKNIIKWLYSIMIMWKKYKHLESSTDDLLISFSITKEYMELVIYREDWYRCMEELF